MWQFVCHKSNFNDFHHSPMPQATFNSMPARGIRSTCGKRQSEAGICYLKKPAPLGQKKPDGKWPSIPR